MLSASSELRQDVCGVGPHNRFLEHLRKWPSKFRRPLTGEFALGDTAVDFSQDAGGQFKSHSNHIFHNLGRMFRAGKRNRNIWLCKRPGNYQLRYAAVNADCYLAEPVDQILISLPGNSLENVISQPPVARIKLMVPL